MAIIQKQRISINGQKIFLKNQIKILEVKKTIIKVKIYQKGKRRYEIEEERIGECEEGTTAIIQSKEDR